MAKTKQRVHKNAMKTIDLSAEKIPVPVKTLIRKVDQSIASQIKIANIPAFNVLASTTNTEAYFKHHNEYVYMLGDSVALLDRIVINAICSIMTDDIYEQMSALKGYVGVWDKYTIYNLLAATITFMKADWTDDQFLTAQQYTNISKEDMEKLPENSCMPFSMYTPQGFFTVLAQIQAVALSYITGMMKARIPKLFASTKELPVELNLTQMFGGVFINHEEFYDFHTTQQDATSEFKNGHNQSGYLYSSTFESTVSQFIHVFEKPFMELMVGFMSESGVSKEIINEMLESSRIHILYDDPLNKHFGEINIQFTLAPERMNIEPKDRPGRIVMGFNIQEIIDIVTGYEEGCSKTAKIAFGKSLRKYVLTLITYAFNIYMANIRANQEATVTEDPEPEVEGEISMDDLLETIENEDSVEVITSDE